MNIDRAAPNPFCCSAADAENVNWCRALDDLLEAIGQVAEPVRALFRFISSLVKLAVYLAIVAGLAYSAVYWRFELVAEAARLGAPEAMLAPVRDRLDQGAALVIANSGRLPFQFPLPLPPAAPAGTAGPADAGKPAAVATTAPSATANAPAPAAPPASARPAPPPVSVLAADVRQQSVPVVLDLLGTVQAVSSIPVKVRLDSQIESVEMKEGDAVKAGQVIFRLDGRAIRAQINQAEALIVRDQALLAQAQSELDRVKPLTASNVTSKKDLDTARSNFDTARANLLADQASLDNLKVQETYYEIRSPIDGRVGSLPLKPGSSIRAADAVLLATINQTTPVYVTFAVPQVSVPPLRKAMRAGKVAVSVGVPGSKSEKLAGVVAFTENAIDASSGTLTVKAKVDNPDEKLLPGQFVDVRVVLRVEDDAVVVPEAAVIVGQQGPYVFALKSDDTVDLIPVTQDRKVDGQVVISKGLTAGMRVIIDGQARLVPNSRVEVRSVAAPLPAAPTQPQTPKTGS
eukprot:gene19680-20143_t